MSETPHNSSNESHEPQFIGEIMPDVIDAIESAQEKPVVTATEVDNALDRQKRAFAKKGHDDEKNRATHELADKSRYWLESRPRTSE